MARTHLAAPMRHGTRENLGYLLVKAARRWDREFIALLTAAGYDDIKPSHGAVFIPLFDGTARTITEMVQASHLTKQTLSIYVRELRDRGYVRAEPDPEDARSLFLSLTGRGERLRGAADEATRAVNASVVRRLGAERVATLRSLLAALVEGP